MLGGLIIAGLAARTLALLSPSALVIVEGRDVKIGDVAAVSGENARRIEALLLVRLPNGSARVSRMNLKRLIERTVPRIRVSGDLDGDLVLTARTPAAANRGCKSAARKISAGSRLVPDDVEPSACSSALEQAALRWDPKSGGVHARTDIPAGANLGRLFVPEAPAIGRGQTMNFVSRSGPVTISRTVTALQPAAKRQRRLFVKTVDGLIFSAPLAGVAQ